MGNWGELIERQREQANLDLNLRKNESPAEVQLLLLFLTHNRQLQNFSQILFSVVYKNN